MDGGALSFIVGVLWRDGSLVIQPADEENPEIVMLPRYIQHHRVVVPHGDPHFTDCILAVLCCVVGVAGILKLCFAMLVVLFPEGGLCLCFL